MLLNMEKSVNTMIKIPISNLCLMTFSQGAGGHNSHIGFHISPLLKNCSLIKFLNACR